MKKVTITSLDDKRMTVLLEGYSIPFANALRRLALSDVPTMAVDFAYFYDNNTSVYDEIIAHRLGLIVFKSDDAIYKYKSPEECKGVDPPNPDCYVEIFLEKEVDENSPTGQYVKAEDLVISDELVKPAYPDTPITYLAPGQRIHLVAYARLGRGKEHAKWSPASIAILQYVPLVEVLDMPSEECRQCLTAYPEILDVIDKGGDRLMYTRNINTSGLRYCAEGPCKDAITLRYLKDRLILTIESTGALKPERILLEAAKRLYARANNLKTLLEAVKGVAR